MEGGKSSEALIARDRCLEAMALSEDIGERRSLWRAASRYAGKARDEVARTSWGEPALADANEAGEVSARVFGD